MDATTTEQLTEIDVAEPFTWFAESPPLPEPVPFDLRHRLPGVVFILKEWRHYRVTVPDATGLWIGNTRLEPAFSGGHFEFSIQNRLGITPFTPEYGDTNGITYYAEVIAEKFPSLKDSLDFSQNLVDQLSARVRQLPFVVRAETSRQMFREHGQPNLFFTFHYLRHHSDDLVRALSIITLDPHRRLGEIVESLRIHQARRIDAEALHSLLSGPRAGKPDTSDNARPLDRLQPLRITQRRPEETYDTAENRFVVAACRRLRSIMQQIRTKSWWWRDATGPDRKQFEAIDHAVRMLLQGDRFRTIEASLSMPAYSRVLQMKPGYREFTMFWSGLSQVHVPQLIRFDQAIDLRDVPTLYEFWQFFELADVIGGHLNLAPSFNLMQDPYPENWGLRATFAGVGTLFTQHVFTGANTYTPITLKPDFVWETVDKRKVVLDAKFAMTSIRDLQIDDETVPASKASTRDITKMHGYRDAIKGVRAALVLYPGTEGAFWGSDGVQQQVNDIYGIIGAVIKCELDGIGAVPMAPRAEEDLYGFSY